MPDKLILRAGHAPGEAITMIDLYAEGSHGHRFKRPPRGYCEAAGAPLFHNLRRRGTRTAQCGNSFWLWPQPEAFPGYPEPNIWNTMTVPTTSCFAADKDGEYRIGRDLLLRNFRTPDLRWLRLDNLRLKGPRGTLVLDGFESPQSWHANGAQHPGVEPVSNPHHTQGRWINLGNRVLECEVANAAAHSLGRDAWGVVEFTNGCGPGNTLQRQLVLTEEGVLVIVDTFTPGREVEGWTGGQLWPLYALQEGVSDWFASASDGAYPQRDGSTAERRMLVKFMTAEDVTVGVERIRPSAMHALEADGRRHDEFYTTYSRAILKACQPVTAALVVLPLKPAEDVAQRAAGVYLEQRSNDEVSTTLALPGKREPLTLLVCGEDVAIDRRGR